MTILGTVDDDTRRGLGARGLEFGPVPLEDLLVHLTDVGRDVQLTDPDEEPQRPPGGDRPERDRVEHHPQHASTSTEEYR